MNDFYVSLNKIVFLNIYKIVQMLGLLGLVFVCEQTFSIKNIN